MKLVINTKYFLIKWIVRWSANSVRFENLMGTGFQMGQILWDFIWQCETWQVWLTNQKLGVLICISAWNIPYTCISIKSSLNSYTRFRRKANIKHYLGHAKRIWYLSPMRAAKVQASLRIRAVSPEPSLLAHTSSESRGTFRQKARSVAHLNGWACAVKICHDGMLEDTNSLGAAHFKPNSIYK